MDTIVQSSISIVKPSENELPAVKSFFSSLLNTTAAAAKPDWTASLPMGDVRVVKASEYKQAAACLADAFAEDDVAQYFTHAPDTEHWTKEQKWDLHVSILEYIVYAHILKGVVLAAGDFESVALWMGPGGNMDDYMTILRSGMWRLQYKLSAEGKTRYFDEFFPLLHETKAEVMGPRDDDSYYLVYIGSRQSARGKGYARKLIEAVTKKADVEGRACYLESSHLINLTIYPKFGFHLQKMIQMVRSDKPVELGIMVREPMSVS